MDLLTPSVNVPAEWEKLRRLRDEIAADVQERERLTAIHGVRGFRRLPDVPALAAEEVGGDGKAQALPVHVETGMDVSSADADMREAQAGCAGCGNCACGVGREKVNGNEFDPNGIAQHAPGAKLDGGKARPWLMLAGFPRALAEVAHVTTVGAKKYTPHGWSKVENGSERYMDAFARHMLAEARGEVIDTDTGSLHKAQMVWNLLASLELDLRKLEGVA